MAGLGVVPPIIVWSGDVAVTETDSGYLAEVTPPSGETAQEPGAPPQQDPPQLPSNLSLQEMNTERPMFNEVSSSSSSETIYGYK